MIAENAATTDDEAPQPGLFTGDAETRFQHRAGYAPDVRDETAGGTYRHGESTRPWKLALDVSAYTMEPPGEILYGSSLPAGRFSAPGPIRELLVEYGERFHPELALTSLSAGAIGGAELQASLADLDDVIKEAHEEGFPPPSKETIELAERLLRGMYGLRPCRFEVYPTQDGEVTLHAAGPPGNSVRVLCRAAEGVLCLVNLDGRQHRRAAYKPRATAALPDGFLREALADLGAAR